MFRVKYDTSFVVRNADYRKLYLNLDDKTLLNFIRKKGIIDVNEVNTNLNYCGSEEKSIFPCLHSLEDSNKRPRERLLGGIDPPHN